MIMLWYGTKATIPSGWHECDGAMGTPNLKGKFIIHPSIFYAQGSTGGAISHSHPFTGDGHNHNLLGGNVIIDSSPAGDFAYGTNISAETGDTDTENHLPPYHALYYIMKL